MKNKYAVIKKIRNAALNTFLIVLLILGVHLLLPHIWDFGVDNAIYSVLSKVYFALLILSVVVFFVLTLCSTPNDDPNYEHESPKAKVKKLVKKLHPRKKKANS